MPDSMFYQKLNSISRDLGLNPTDLLLVMFFESGVNPNAKNPGGAQGLIQFMPDTLRGMGVSENKVRNFRYTPASEQLDYVKKYIEGKRSLMGGKPFTSATQYYHANFFPKTLSRWKGINPFANRNVIVVSSTSRDPRERAAYASNKVLDKNNDGIISVGDLTATMLGAAKSPQFQTMLKQLNETTGRSGQVSEIRYLNKKHKTYQPEPKQVATTEQFGGGLLASFFKRLGDILDNLTREAGSIKMNTINKYGSNYPQNKYLISVDSGSDLSSKLEFARILTLALKEEIDANTEIYTDGQDVEVQCIVSVEQTRGLYVLSELCNTLSETFEYATKKIGGIKTNTFVMSNEDSCYQKLDIKLSETNYRKFQLKFIK